MELAISSRSSSPSQRKADPDPHAFVDAYLDKTIAAGRYYRPWKMPTNDFLKEPHFDEVAFEKSPPIVYFNPETYGNGISPGLTMVATRPNHVANDSRTPQRPRTATPSKHTKNAVSRNSASPKSRFATRPKTASPSATRARLRESKKRKQEKNNRDTVVQTHPPAVKNLEKKKTRGMEASKRQRPWGSPSTPMNSLQFARAAYAKRITALKIRPPSTFSDESIVLNGIPNFNELIQHPNFNQRRYAMLDSEVKSIYGLRHRHTPKSERPKSKNTVYKIRKRTMLFVRQVMEIAIVNVCGVKAKGVNNRASRPRSAAHRIRPKGPPVKGSHPSRYSTPSKASTLGVVPNRKARKSQMSRVLLLPTQTLAEFRKHSATRRFALRFICKTIKVATKNVLNLTFTGWNQLFSKNIVDRLIPMTLPKESKPLRQVLKEKEEQASREQQEGECRRRNRARELALAQAKLAVKGSGAKSTSSDNLLSHTETPHGMLVPSRGPVTNQRCQSNNKEDGLVRSTLGTVMVEEKEFILEGI